MRWTASLWSGTTPIDLTPPLAAALPEGAARAPKSTCPTRPYDAPRCQWKGGVGAAAACRENVRDLR
eukprot:920494-Alexandrium_andersonii.AAC.1